MVKRKGLIAFGLRIEKQMWLTLKGMSNIRKDRKREAERMPSDWKYRLRSRQGQMTDLWGPGNRRRGSRLWTQWAFRVQDFRDGATLIIMEIHKSPIMRIY